MQTFLPYPDLRASSVVLDDRRLGKQRVETLQILRALTWDSYAWKNHPAVRMWRGFVPALVCYGRENCREWVRRGYADSVAGQLLEWTDGVEAAAAPLPPWFGWEPVHRSHRQALLRKEPAWYADRFVDEDPSDFAGYVWPREVFPRWPIRSGGHALDPAAALGQLGLDALAPGQAEAVEAVTQGRDVLLVMRPGTGGSSAGLLAGLATKGRTLVVSPPLLPRAGPVPRVVGPAHREVTASGPMPAIGRTPGPAERLAMRAETQPAEFVFAAADRLDAELPPGPGDEVGLLVVERAGQFDPAQCEAVLRTRNRLGDPPVLALLPRADPAQREAVSALLALREPVHAGGGWDPGSRLSAAVVGTARARAGAVAAYATAEGGPVLIVCATREIAERRSGRLLAAGVRAATWAPPPMRAQRAASALAAWRSRRLDALVATVGALPPLGRTRVGLLISEDPPSPESWRQEIEIVHAERSVLVVGPEAAPQVRALAVAPGCLRAALLSHLGEPVTVPCGRCERCTDPART